MRRVVGAGLLMVILGGGHAVDLIMTRHAPPAPVAERVSVTPAPASPARSPYPAAYLSHPLGFISTAPADSLDLLPGIGPVLAARIVADRAARGPFTSWTELDRVRGIGPATVARLQAAARRP
jgi:competence protein ComEA